MTNWKSYERDQVTGEIYEKRTQGFTAAEWDEFCDRWDCTRPGSKKQELTTGEKVGLSFCGFVLIYMAALQLLRLF